MSTGINGGGSIGTDAQFRDFVVSSLSELTTQMRLLVGRDGNGGMMQEMKTELSGAKDRIADLESSRRDFRTRTGIIITALNLGWGIVLAAVGAYIKTKR